VTVEPSLEFEHTLRVWATRVFMLVLSGLLLWAGIFNFGPSWTAHTGGGVRGTFTATMHHCGSCPWYGFFTPSDGGPGRIYVRMGNGAHGITAIGDTVPAIDTGAVQVFPVNGTTDWIVPLAAMAVGGGMLVMWCVRVLRPVVRRARDDEMRDIAA
jgi:hypothetical protein